MFEQPNQNYSFEIKDFIGVFNNFMPKEYCKNIINVVEKNIEFGYGRNRKQEENLNSIEKDDTSLFLSSEQMQVDKRIAFDFIQEFWKTAYSLYSEKYSVLKNSGGHSIYYLKLQKTLPGQGYHTWHYESSAREVCQRLLTFILYLNDVEEGGETEFLYLGKRIKPTTGTLILWPTSFTHTHRGNPPLNEIKYILTGWIEF